MTSTPVVEINENTYRVQINNPFQNDDYIIPIPSNVVTIDNIQLNLTFQKSTNSTMTVFALRNGADINDPQPGDIQIIFNTANGNFTTGLSAGISIINNDNLNFNPNKTYDRIVVRTFPSIPPNSTAQQLITNVDFYLQVRVFGTQIATKNISATKVLTP